jgi:tape measure domain-containing protein
LKSIDERIVDMQFNNKQFEDGIQTSLKSLDNLKKGLDETGKGRSLEAIQTGVETLSSKFSALGIMGVTALQNIANSAIDAGVKLVKSLSTDRIMDGFNEYELKMGSVQTIMAGSGESLETVNKYLDQLNTYADKTIYSFKDMTSNIGKFTNAGVSLDRAVAAIQGVSNLAAVSGANANEASRAMYNFAQALSAGYVKLIDWKSIENANMATVEFKNQLLEAGVAAGTLAKTSSGMYRVLTTNGAGKKMEQTIDATKNFNDSLAYQWMVSDALIDTLKNYSDETTDIGKKAFAAAQDIKTFSQLMDTLKEAVGSGWAKTFEILEGDFEEAKSLWTGVNKVVSGVIDSMSDARNALLTGAMTTGWKQIMAQGVIDSKSFQESIIDVAEAHGVSARRMIGNAGSFEESLREGWVTAGILGESITKLADKFRDLSDEELAEAGHTREAVDKLLALEAAVKDGSVSVGEFSAKLSLVSGREVLIKALGNAFKFVASVLKPIKEGFAEIFPPLTSDRLYGMITGLKEFTKTLKISGETADGIKRTFKGLFAIVDIVGQFVSFLAGKVKDLVDALLPGEGILLGSRKIQGALLDFTAGIGDWLVGLNDAIRASDVFNTAFNTVKDGITKVAEAVKEDVKGMLETPFFVALQDALTVAGEKIQEAFGKIKDIFSGWSGIDLSGAKSFVDGAIASFRPFTALGTALSAGFELIQKVWEKVKPFFDKMAAGISSAFGKISEAVGGALRDGGFKGALDLVNAVLAGGILVGIRKFIDGLSEVTKGAGGILDGVKSILDGVRGSLEAYQSKLKAGTLLTIAGAVALLAASVAVLSLIDPGKLAAALGAITTLFVELAGTMIVLNKALGTKGMVKGAEQMVLLSAAVLILSFAVKNLAELSWEQLAKGLTGVGALLTELAGFTQIVKTDKLVSTGVGMIAIGVALKIMAGAVASLGALDFNVLAQGLGGIGAIFAEVAGFTQIVKPEKLISTGIGMIAMGAALLIIGNAVASLGALNMDVLAKGLGAIGVILLEIGGFTQIVKPEKLISTGIAMIAMGTALVIISSAVKTLGSMPMEQLAAGLVAMGVALAEIAGFTQIVSTEKIFTTGLAMIAMGAALLIIAQAVTMFGSLTWEQIAAGLVAMGGSLLILAVAANAMTGALAGAAAMLVMASAIMLLVPALYILGNMDIAEIGVALLALAGVFLIVGVAGLVLGPLTPVILALAGAIALLGVGVLAIGVGLLAFSAGLTALAVSGAAGGAVLITLVKDLLDLIPLIIRKLGEGIIAFAEVITEGTPKIMEAVKAIALGLIQVLTEIIPDLTAALLLLLTTLLEQLAESVPQMVDAGMKLLLGILEGIEKNIKDITATALRILSEFLDGIAEGIPDVVESAVNVATEFMEAIGKEGPRLIDSGFKMIIDFLNGLADAIENNMQDLIDAAGRVGEAIINGIKDALFAGVKGVGDAAANLGKGALDGIKGFLGIHSPSKVFEEEIGKNMALGTAQGIDANASKAAKAAKKMADDAYGSAKLWIKNYRNDSEYLASEELAMWETLGKKYVGISKEKVEIDKNAAALRKKILKDDTAAEKEAYEDYKKWIEHKRKLNEMTAEEEIEAWATLRELYEEGSEYRMEVDEKLYEAKARADKDSFEHSKSWIEQKKKLGELSAKEEIAAWERVGVRYAEGSEQRKEADVKLYEARTKAEKDSYEASSKWIDDRKKLGELSMAEEVRAWERVQTYYLEGTEERKNADIELFEAKKKLQEEYDKLLAQSEETAKKYADAVDERAKSIAGTFGLFAELKEKEEVAGSTLTKNLQDQVEEMQSWSDNLEKLSKKGIDEGLLDELRKMGPSANAEIAALAGMSERELTSYADLWKQKQELARTQAVKELEGLREETNQKLQEIQDDIKELGLTPDGLNKVVLAGADALDAIVGEYKDRTAEVVSAAGDINVQVLAELNGAAPEFEEAGGNLIAAFDKGAEDERPDVVATAKTTTQKALAEITSFLQKFYDAGRQSIGGFISGMKSQIEEAAGTAAAIARAAYEAAMAELGIHSPSRAFMELGRFSVLGLAEGFGKYSYLADNAAVDALKQTMALIGDILDSDLDTAPVIRPVVDLDAVDAGIRDINSRRINLSGTIAAASRTSGSVNGSRELAQGGQASGGKTFQFTQNNYSPKALSRIEIYRQTRNQFSAMKGALSQT